MRTAAMLHTSLTGLTRRHAILAALACLAPTAWAAEAPPEVRAELPEARTSGRGTFTFWGLHIYDAQLWVGPAFKANSFERHPLALTLTYARSLDGERIAERSLVEMQKQAALPTAVAERWLDEMKRAFPNVKAGDRLTGVLRPGESARFFLNGQFKREVRDADFAQRFFAIWLSPRSTAPALRTALLGGA